MPRKHPNPAARKFRAKIARKLEAQDPLRQYIRGVRAENHLLQSSQAARDWAALEARVRITHSDEH